MKRNRLRIARNVGWLAEFPDDVWGMIIDFLPLDEYGPDIGTMLCLTGTSKRMCNLLQTRILMLFSKVITFCTRPYIMMTKSKRDYWLMYIYRFFNAYTPLEKYVTQCMSNEAYQTREHITNCLSLLHLAVCEGRYLDADNHSILEPYRYTPLTGPTKTSYLCNLFYFRPSTKKAITVSRMFAEVGVVTHFTRHGKGGTQPLYDDACDILKKNLDETRHSALRHYISTDLEPFAARTIIVDVIRGEGKEPIKTQRPRCSDSFESLIVKLDGSQHYIFSPEAESFVRNCFHSSLSVENATKAFIFDSFHARNWAIVTESDRFKVFK